VFKGPSGSGKTTLLTLVGCLARPTRGRITLDGRLLSNLPERFLTEVRRHTFGFVFQQFHLIRGLTVLDNVMLPAYPLGRPYRELANAARNGSTGSASAPRPPAGSNGCPAARRNARPSPAP